MSRVATYTVRAWTEDEIDSLRYFYELGYTQAQMSKELHRSITSIGSKIRYLRRRGELGPVKSKYRRWSQTDLNALTRMYTRGLDTSHIASALDRSLPSVLRAINLYINSHHENVRAGVKRMREDGIPEEEVMDYVVRNMER